MDENKNEARSVREEMSREQTYWKRNFLWSVLLIVAVLVFSLFRGSGLSVAPSASELMLTLHDGTAVVIPYEQITEAELLEQPEFGTMLEGKDDLRGKSGSWEHPEWGTYTLCVYRSSDKVVRLVAGERIYTVSLASAADTEQLYGIILEKSPAD